MPRATGAKSLKAHGLQKPRRKFRVWFQGNRGPAEPVEELIDVPDHVLEIPNDLFSDAADECVGLDGPPDSDALSRARICLEPS